MGLSTNQQRTWFLQGIQDWHDDDDDDDDEYDEYEDELNTKNKFTLVSAKKLGLVLKVDENWGNKWGDWTNKKHTALGHWTSWMPGPLHMFSNKSLRSGEWVQFNPIYI